MDLEGNVDDSLFTVDTLGKLPPAADVVFDVPNRIDQLVEEVLDK